MKKFMVIVLALALVLSFCGCAQSDSAEMVKKDYEAYNWEGATQVTQVAEAQRLVARINMLTASEQQELTEIKGELEKIIKTSDGTVNPTDYPENSMMPDDSRIGEDSINPKQSIEPMSPMM